jgi:acyl CoA:acetate/3-ketoacid CoA transferase
MTVACSGLIGSNGTAADPLGSLVGDEEVVAGEVLAVERAAHAAGGTVGEGHAYTLTAEIEAIRGIPAGALGLGASLYPYAIVDPSAQFGPTAGPSISRHGKQPRLSSRAARMS